jgi:hypothetical protein
LACDAIHALVNPACRAITGRQTAPPAERDDLRVLLKGIVVGIGARRYLLFWRPAAIPGNVCTALSGCSFFVSIHRVSGIGIS